MTSSRSKRYARFRSRQTTRNWHQTVRGRLIVVGTVFGFWTLGIEARLIYLQVVKHEELTARAEGQQRRSIEADPKRGEILDRRGRVLAYSVDGDAIYAVPNEIDDPKVTTESLCVPMECS